MDRSVLEQLGNYELVAEGILVKDVSLWRVKEIMDASGIEYRLDADTEHEGVVIITEE